MILPQEKDPIEEVNLGMEKEPHITWISSLLDKSYKENLVRILNEYNDCFALEYHEMPGLDRAFVEH